MTARECGNHAATATLGNLLVGLTVALLAGAVLTGLWMLGAVEAHTTGAFSLLVAAKAGWGKSFKAQHVIEQNLPEYDHVLVLDFKDEYRGVVKAGLARWWIAGPRERDWSSSTWHDFVENQRKLVVARHDRMGTEEWRDVCAAAIKGVRRLGDVLVVIDEAHFVAPQTGKVPAAITGLATTGRGEGASSVWITQRLSEAEETVLAQCDARLLGGFESDADLGKVGSITEYPTDLHNPQVRGHISGVADVLQPDDRDTPMSVQKHEQNGSLRGSEWIYSNDSGERERRNTAGLVAEMTSEHMGREGKDIKV